VPAAVVLLVATFRVDDPEPPLTEVELKVAVTPVGAPDTLKATVPLNVPTGLTFTV